MTAQPVPLPADEADVVRVLLTETVDDEGNARCALALLNGEFAYCGAFGWLHWSGTHWQPDPDEAEIDQAILAALKQRRKLAVDRNREDVIKNTSGSAARLRAVKQVFRALVAMQPEDFDQSPDELNVANGVLNLRTGALTPHDHAQRFTYCLSTPYDPEADDSLWRSFLAEVVQDDPDIPEYLQMAVGYSLTGDTSEECLWYIHGPTRSGKGTFTETLLALLGTPLAVEVDFATFTAKREGDTQNFDLAPLKPARFIVTSESNRYESLNTGKIKQLTGGNYVRCAHKHRAIFTYHPQFKPWLVSNHPVNADVDDDALWNRVQVIKFPHSRIGREDKTLKKRLRSPEALRGVLRWAVEGAIAWYAAEHGLVHPKAVRLNTKAHRTDLDMVQAWFIERCEEGDDKCFTPFAEAYGNYAQWCKDNGVEAKKARGFSEALREKGFVSDVKRITPVKTARVVIGLRLL